MKVLCVNKIKYNLHYVKMYFYFIENSKILNLFHFRHLGDMYDPGHHRQHLRANLYVKLINRFV